MKGSNRERDPHAVHARRSDAADAGGTDFDRLLAEHSRRRRQFEQDQQNPVILIIGMLVVAILLATSWWMLDRMRCDFFYSDLPVTHPARCR